MKSQNSKEKKSDFSYKDTLNLLKTDFSMRANSVVREPEIQNFWADNNIDFKLGSNNSGKNLHCMMAHLMQMERFIWVMPLIKF